MISRTDQLTTILVAISFAAAACFWISLWMVRASYDRYVTVSRSTIAPFLLTGLQFDYDDVVVNAAAAPHHVTNAPHGRQLLVVLSDDCHYCQQIESHACAALEARRISNVEWIDFVSFHGSQLAAHLADCAAHGGTVATVRVLTTTDSRAFTLLTGLAGTPAFAVLDNNRRLERVFLGSAGSLEHLSAYLSKATGGFAASVAR